MREQLIQYVQLLFAAAPDAEEMKEEILHNTLDRYDDLIDQGKSPEAAYRLAISGIGDINEILGGSPAQQSPVQDFRSALREETDHIQSQKMRAVAIAMYILCPVPLFILSEFGLDTLGLCLTLAMVATATYVIMLIKRGGENSPADTAYVHEPEYTTHILAKRKAGKIIWCIGMILFLITALLTHFSFIIWIIPAITACVQGLVNAILDLKEADKYEN